MAFSYKFVDQANLISKLNAYLTAQGRATIDTLGYCNGLAALYLYARSQDKQQEFLEQIQSILEKKDSDLAPDPIIDNFLEKILLLQAPSVFLQNSAQTNLDRSIELVRTRNQPQLRHEFNLAFAFSQAELAKVLNEIPDNKMLLLGSPAHAIGLYKKEGKYFLFDANSINIPEMEISSAESAAYFVKLSMETTGDENQAEFLPLQINIFDRADRPAGQYKKPEQTVRELLAANPKAARTSLWQGYSPLHTAAFAGNAEVVKVLLENGSDPNAVATVPEHAHTHLSDTYTPLHLAVFSGNQAAVSALLEHGAKVEIKNGHNGSALALAVLQRNEQVAETLLKFNADPNESNAQGQSLLRSAVSSDNGAMAKLLLEYKAQPNLADMNGVTPLMIAVMNNNLSMASLLLENGASSNASTRIGRTALMLAVQSGNQPMARLLLEHGADPFLQNKQGKSAMSMALDSGSAMVQTILQAGQAEFKAAAYLEAFKMAISQSQFAIGFQVLQAGFNAIVAPLFKATAAPTASATAITTPLLAVHTATHGAAGVKLSPDEGPSV